MHHVLSLSIISIIRLLALALVAEVIVDSTHIFTDMDIIAGGIGNISIPRSMVRLCES